MYFKSIFFTYHYISPRGALFVGVG